MFSSIHTSYKGLPPLNQQVVHLSTTAKTMQVKKQQLELVMEQQTGSKSGKEYFKAIYCHPAYLTYMQRISCEALGCGKHKLESRLLGEIAITAHHTYGRKQRRTSAS